FSSASTASSAATISGQSSTYSSTLVSTSPRVYYRMGDLTSYIADSSGNLNASGVANDAKAVGSVTIGAAGPLEDGAVTVSGSGYVQDQSLTNLPSGTSARTFEAWVKTANVSDQV